MFLIKSTDLINIVYFSRFDFNFMFLCRGSLIETLCKYNGPMCVLASCLEHLVLFCNNLYENTDPFTAYLLLSIKQ